MTISVRNMRTPAGGAVRGRRKKLGTGVLLLLGIFAGLIGLAPVASAHHAYVQGGISSSCDADGNILVSFQVRSWDTVNSGNRVLNSNIGVQYRTNTVNSFLADNNTAASLVGYSADVYNGQFTNNNSGGVPFFNGSFTLPASEGGKYIQLRSYPKASWTSSGGSTTAPSALADDSYVIAPQPLPTGCKPPAKPSATATLVCAENKINIDFTGVGSATTVDISKNNVLVGNDVPVPVGASTFALALAAGDENTTVDIDLDYAASSATDQLNISVPVDCKTPPAPSARIAWECGADVSVGLSNSGGESVTADILKNGVVVHDDVAVPGSYAVAITGADENTSVNITVVFSDASTATDVTQLISVDCDKPQPTISEPACAEGGVAVTLGNVAGTDVATFAITVNGVAQTPVQVPAGQSQPYLVPVAEDGTVDIAVSSGDVSKSWDDYERDCQKPVASVTFTCAEGGVVVLLTNSGVEAAVVDVDGEQVSVPAGTTAGDPVKRVIPVDEGDDYSITVLGETESGIRDCENPVASVEFSCVEGGVVVLLTNSGESDTIVDVAGEQVTVPAGTTADDPVKRVITVDEGDDYSVTVLGQTDSGTRDCEKPAVLSIALECAEGGVVVVLANDGELPANVSVNGGNVVVPVGGTSVTVPVAENAGYDFDVVVDGVTTEVTGTRNCEELDGSVVFECAEGGVVVSVTNTGDVPTSFTINGGTPIELGVDETYTATIPVGEGDDYTVTIAGEGLSESTSGTRNCEEPEIAAANLECAEGGVVVALTNDGELDASVLVDGIAVNVPAGTTAEDPVEVLVPVDEDAAYDFTVVGDGLDQSFSGVANCLLPEPTVDDEVVCATGGLNVVLRNTGDDTATYVITSPALPGGELEATVEAGDVETVLIPLEEDASTDVVVTSGEDTLFDATLTRDCETVGGVVVPPSLPRTGANTTGLLGLAGALLLAGFAFLTGARRREVRLS